MARDWEKLAGENGQDVPAGRFSRLLRVGTLGVGVSTSALARKVGQKLGPGRGKPDAAADALFRTQQAQRVLRVLGELKGATMKVGQILSSDPDLLPPEFIEALSELQRDAPPMTYRTVKGVLEETFGRPIEDIFHTFDPDPAGSASIGQVHHGTLLTGEDVAVKIQYPGIAETLESDLKNLASLLTLGRILVDKNRLDDYLEEARHVLLEEVDYEAEAVKLNRFHDFFRLISDIRIPKAYPKWTRPNVLTMEFIDGEKLDAALKAMPHGLDRNRLLGRFVEIYAWMFHELHELHADPHPGNFILQADGCLAILDFGCVKRCDPTFADGILDIMDACWQHDNERATKIYQRLGFGGKNTDLSSFDPELLRSYHDIVLEPFLKDEPFEFGRWELRPQLQRFVLEHPVFLKLVPPAEGLLVLRVMGGIKGLLNKLDGCINVHRMAVDIAKRRGRLTGPPKL
jgi:predicted unusual protein kinase regulating ubiquinone biosynthesis (AarF/ABC1/UbiB family)